ncbi:MAG: redoxin domain-containing protein [Dehalococcoidia bacterium]|jgi:peroxiredoxin
MSLKIGDQVENIQLYNQDKEVTRLVSTQTDFTLIAFFPGAFTALCSIGMNQIDTYLDDLKDKKITLVGVSVDSPFALANWKEENNIRYNLLSDFDRECVSKFDVAFDNLGGIEGYISANRAVMIVDKTCKLVYQWIGEHPGDEPNYDKLLEIVKALE